MERVLAGAVLEAKTDSVMTRPEIQLEADEARVLGVLIEKEACTPDQYPLSLNALTSGCNQKSNRDPVMNLGESTVYSCLERLRMQQLAGAVHPLGSRVERFRHNAGETLGASPRELAVLAELLMRGSQARGELRQRAHRMQPMQSLEELEAVLSTLKQKGLVVESAPAPGSRANQIDERLSRSKASSPSVASPSSAGKTSSAPGDLSSAQPTASAASSVSRSASERGPASDSSRGAPGGGLESRVEELEREVRRLSQQLSSLARGLGEELPD